MCHYLTETDNFDTLGVQMLDHYFVSFFPSSIARFLGIRIIFIVVVILAACSGYVAPRMSFPNAPQITSAVNIQNKHTQLPKSYHVQLPKQNQITVISIGQEKIVITPTPTSVQQKSTEWGKATQIDEHTWTMSVEKDERMASTKEIFDALNSYRQKKGKSPLAWDQTLASYADSRAVLFAKSGNTDKHAGFTDYINNQDGFAKLGFNAVGENSSYGYQLYGVHLIEWVYAGDAPHDDNQLSSSWSHVGIGVSGAATDLIFAGSRR